MRTLSKPNTLLRGSRLWRAAFLGSILAVFASVARADLATDLIAYYPMDGNAQDKKGTAHGTSGDGSPLVFTAGKFGQGVDLDGVAQYIVTPESKSDQFNFGVPDAPTGFSVSAWFRVDDFTKSWQCLIAKGEGQRWRIHRRDAGTIMTGNGGHDDVPAGETEVKDGKIHHLVLVSDPKADKATLYVDGKVEGETEALANEANDMPMMIGENPDARNRTWDGLIDDVALWKRALTAVEVTQLYTSGKSLGDLIAPPAVTVGTDIVGYWNFDGGFADSVSSLKGELIEGAKIGTGKTGGGLDVGGDNTMAKLRIEDASVIGKKVAAKDQLTVAFWQKNTSDVRDQSAFWWESESSGGGQRGVQAHTPWSNGRIYFDSVGCCTAGTQRLEESAGDLDFSVWNHFAFVKDKDKKRIYVNGAVLVETEGADPLPEDLLALNIGCNSPVDGGARAVPGILDDFAIWASALSEADIKKLAAGQAPISGGSAPPPKASLSGVTVTRELLTIEYTDAAGSVLDPASVKVKVDGKDVTSAVAAGAGAGKTNITYKPNPIFAHGSTHTYEVAAKDKAGADVSSKGETKLPSPAFPEANLPGPKPVNGAWATRFIFGDEFKGNMTGLKKIFQVIDDASKAGFTGKVVDGTSPTINYGDAGFFADSPGYPDKVTNTDSWDAEDFINLNIAHIKITEPGLYTFGVHSDDGFALRIRGAKFISKSGNGSLDKADPEALLHPTDTGDSSTRGVAELAAGVYRIEFLWWERGGGDNGEIYAAKGSFLNDGDTDQWKLIGDTAGSAEFTKLGVDSAGWSVQSSLPKGDALNTNEDGLNDLKNSPGKTANYDILDVGDPQTNAGKLPFPENTTADDDDFALLAKAKLVVPTDGTYVIGFNSDDGAYVKIAGQSFKSIITNGTGTSAINDKKDTVECSCLTGDSNTTAEIDLKKGTYDIEAFMFERGGGAYLTVKSGQKGTPLSVLAKNGAGVSRVGGGIPITDEAVSSGGGGTGGQTGGTRPKIGKISFSGNNILIESAGAAIESSTDLKTWSAVNGAPANGVFTVPRTAADRLRFYRAK